MTTPTYLIKSINDLITEIRLAKEKLSTNEDEHVRRQMEAAQKELSERLKG